MTAPDSLEADVTLKEIEEAIRASLEANFTEESDMLAWAEALKAERERIEARGAGAEYRGTRLSAYVEVASHGAMPPTLHIIMRAQKRLDGVPVGAQLDLAKEYELPVTEIANRLVDYLEKMP